MTHRLLVIVDASPDTGGGHAARQAILAREVGLHTVVLTQTPEGVESFFNSVRDCEVVPLSEPLSYSMIGDYVREGDIVVLDPPYFPTASQDEHGSFWNGLARCLSRDGRSRVVFFTDEERPTPHTCDLLVNDHPKSPAFLDDYSASAKRVLAGAHYFLHPSAGHTPSMETGEGRHVVFSFGAYDQEGLMGKCEEAIARVTEKHEVLLFGPERPGRIPKGARHVPFCSHSEFLSTLGSAYFAVTAAGNTLYERCIARVPGVSMAQFARQDTIGKEFHRLGLSLHLGLGTEVMPAAVVDAMDEMMRNVTLLQGQVVAMNAHFPTTGSSEIVASVRSLL